MESIWGGVRRKGYFRRGTIAAKGKFRKYKLCSKDRKLNSVTRGGSMQGMEWEMRGSQGGLRPEGLAANGIPTGDTNGAGQRQAGHRWQFTA